MKRFLSFLLVIILLYTACSNSEDNILQDEGEDIRLNDIDYQQDVLINDILIDTVLDISSEDSYDNDDTLVADMVNDISESQEDVLSNDIIDSDLSLAKDIILSDIINSDLEDTEDIYADITYGDITDVEDISDTSQTLIPPLLNLLTKSPNIETDITIGGEAKSGITLYLFRNKDCSAKPEVQISVNEFNSKGISVQIFEGSTNYFSAYVSDGLSFSECSNFITYVHHNNAYWRVSFFDDFKGMQKGEDPECYSMPPQCIGEYLSGLYECPKSEVHSGLSALNKCNWTILRQPNWMAKEYGPDKNGTNGFTPLEVTVEPATDNGVLILSANAYKWDGKRLNKNSLSQQEQNCLSQPQNNWLLHEDNTPDCSFISYDCVFNKNTLNCPVMSGAVYSKQFDNYKSGPSTIEKNRGFTQEYGIWEVRAKLPKGMGSFPAHWLLPQSGSWPERGEIDIMEADRYTYESFQTYHTGYCEGSAEPYYENHMNCINNGGMRHHLSVGGRLRLKQGSFANDYHTFSVEWSKDKIEFFTDNINTITIKYGDPNYGIFTDYLRSTGQARPMNIPFGKFFTILNQTVHNDLAGEIELLNFITHLHIIDYVKVYDTCLDPLEFCDEGFYFDGNDNLCHPVDRTGTIRPYTSPCKLREEIIPATIPLDTQRFYSCTDPCPYGNYFDGSNCQIFISPSHREVFFYPDEQGNLYYATDGSPDGNCKDTVNGATFSVGGYDGANCYLDKALPELYGRYFRWGSTKPDSFYYQPFCKFQ